jgi:outer membrane protein assembly factor BamD (BamD/ComL family)
MRILSFKQKREHGALACDVPDQAHGMAFNFNSQHADRELQNSNIGGRPMSVSGISSNLFGFSNPTVQSKAEQIQQEFQQLGEDLQSGNLSAAQSDYTTLEQLVPQSSTTTSTQNSNPLAQAFTQLGQDLQSGNLSAAQQDYANIQQDIQNQASQLEGHSHHHHHGGGDSEQSSISQLFEQLGQDLQSGNLSGAQQSYNTLTQDLEGLGLSTVQSNSQAPSSSSGISVNA